METWTLTPTLELVRADGLAEFTAAEFAAQQWPPCPVCGTPIIVTGVDVGSLAGGTRVTPGRWRCPSDCDPRTGLHKEIDMNDTTNKIDLSVEVARLDAEAAVLRKWERIARVAGSQQQTLTLAATETGAADAAVLAKCAERMERSARNQRLLDKEHDLHRQLSEVTEALMHPSRN